MKERVCTACLYQFLWLSSMNDTRRDVIDYWDARSTLGEMAGTPDLIAKQLEMRTLAQHVPPNGTVLDAGCGNGLSMAYLKHALPDIKIYGIDNSEGMVTEARKHLAAEGVQAYVHSGSVLDFHGSFDCIYTERVIVNLPDWETQRAAILRILGCLKPGGTYLMMENSQDGLHQINELRTEIGLDVIIPPWHNRYMRVGELDWLYDNEHGTCVEIVDYSAQYYYLSRVVNAWEAKQRNEEPRYDAPINQLALKLPYVESEQFHGQGRLWIWELNSET